MELVPLACTRNDGDLVFFFWDGLFAGLLAGFLTFAELLLLLCLGSDLSKLTFELKNIAVLLSMQVLKYGGLRQ